MTNTSSPQARAQFERCLAIIRQASVEILLLLKVYVAEGKDPRWFLEQLDQARMNLGGWGAVAKRLNLDDASLSQFTLQLRHLQQYVPQYDGGQDVSDNQLIAAMRFVGSLENLRQRQPLLTYSTDFSEEDEAEQQLQALQQLRALELTLEDMVKRAWPDSQKLTTHLKVQFGVDRVRNWIKRGERDDILSGMQFSEKALLISDKKEYSSHYSNLFSDASALTLFVDPRKTLQTFLDDCRQIRNSVLADESLTSAQLMLLDSYTAQITGPIQRAFDRGRTKVNPASFMAVDAGELERFWVKARKKDKEAGGDVANVRDAMERQIHKVKRSPEDRDQFIANILWGAVGAMALLMAIGGAWMIMSEPTPQRSSAYTVSSGEEDTNRNNPLPPDRLPRDRLASMGVRWDVYNMRSAIDRNDTGVVLLFLQGGMNWKLSWTEQAQAMGYDDVLSLLLRYRIQMDEEKPCRRFINTVTHEMANGRSLTSMRKNYLRSFCTRPAVIERQRYETEQARLRAQSSPDAQSQKWLDIQETVYDVIR